MGPNIRCLSYRDHVDFGIVADRDQMDGAWPMTHALHDSLNQLEDAVCRRPTAPRPKARAKVGT